ncbi:MAG: ABC transporter permease [Haloarculaceae archaeon]
MRSRRRAVGPLLALSALLAAWGAAALAFGPSVAPSPLRVAARLGEFLVEGARGRSALYHLWRSLLRVAVVSALALVLSTALGLATGIDDRAEAAVGVWLPVWMTVPTLVVVLVAMVLLEFGEAAVVVGVTFVATPFATANVREGARAVDPDLLEMARAFGVDRRGVVGDVYLPATLPHVLGSLRYLLGMVWKVVVLAETFGMNEGLGAMFRFWFTQGDVTAILAYLSLFVAVMVAVQGAIGVAADRLFPWQA